MKTWEAIVFLITKGPGRTVEELSKAIYGPESYRQRINHYIIMLEARGLIERRGNPNTWWPTHG